MITFIKINIPKSFQVSFVTRFLPNKVGVKVFTCNYVFLYYEITICTSISKTLIFYTHLSNANRIIGHVLQRIFKLLALHGYLHSICFQFHIIPI